jgi:hypothetical protein
MSGTTKTSDRSNASDSAVMTASAPLNEITVLFEDSTVTFPMPAAATLADLAGRLTDEGGPQRQLLSVTIKLGDAIGFRKRSSLSFSRPSTGSGIVWRQNVRAIKRHPFRYGAGRLA